MSNAPYAPMRDHDDAEDPPSVPLEHWNPPTGSAVDDNEPTKSTGDPLWDEIQATKEPEDSISKLAVLVVVIFVAGGWCILAQTGLSAGAKNDSKGSPLFDALMVAQGLFYIIFLLGFLAGKLPSRLRNALVSLPHPIPAPFVRLVQTQAPHARHVRRSWCSSCTGADSCSCSSRAENATGL